MIVPAVLGMALCVLTCWLDRREREAAAYLIEENRLLRRPLAGRGVVFTDDDRRRLAARAYRVGRAVLREIATIVTPDTLLRWRRQLITRKWAASPRRPLGDPPARRADSGGESDLGYTRIQGAPKNVGHRGGRSTVRRILKAAGLPPVPQRSTSWRTVVRAHWGAVADADFFTSESNEETFTSQLLHSESGLAPVVAVNS